MFNFFIARQWSSGTVTVPTTEGLEYTLPTEKAGYTLDRLHGGYTLPVQKAHYDIEDEK